MDFSSKIILITGAYRGIGKELVKFFINKKATVIMTYHNHLDETIKLKDDIIKEYNGKIDCMYLDLCSEDSIKKIFNDIKNKYGKIDVLINNASLSKDNDIQSKNKSEMMKVLEVNVCGTFLMMKYFDSIIHNGYIFNISSTDGVDTGSIYSIDYNASKAGINSLTKTFSLYSNNKIISICPNWVDVDSTNEMDKEYLKLEMKRIKQDKLINPLTICKVISDCINNDIKSGSIIRIDGDSDVKRIN